MSQFSKTSLQRLNSHLSTLKNASESYNRNYKKSKYKTLNHVRVFTRNKNLVKALLIELIFLNVESKNLTKKENPLLLNPFFQNKKLFVNTKFYSDSYLVEQSNNIVNNRLQTLKKQINLSLSKIKSNSSEDLRKLVVDFKKYINNSRKVALLKKSTKLLNQKAKIYCNFITNKSLGKWYIYLARFFIISLLDFIPFIQLTTTLFYNQPNKLISHPITSNIFNLLPFLVPTINITMPVLNQDTISFLLLVPYLYFFIYSFRKYNISRKIAYQGSFALALMLFRYSLILSQEAVTVIYKFTKRFFFLRKFQNIDLLREDITFYIEDLEELRMYREEFLQLGESIFSLEDITRITRLWESTTIFSMLGVIALLYNYMYFIFRGQKPIIPVVTKTVQRMMIDRNGRES